MSIERIASVNNQYAPEPTFEAYNDGKSVIVDVLAPGFNLVDFKVSATKDALRVSAEESTAEVSTFAEPFLLAIPRAKENQMPITKETTTVTYVAGTLRVAIAIPESMKAVELNITE
ncbi:MAG TPA: Hsp20/alpha crystallin family protein [Bacteroidales bacterium]|nr:Hsp20/alpha crystallin family protein [Bacteroidales bacterium]